MSGLIVIDGEKVELPDAKHDLCRMVAPHVPKLVRLLPSDSDRIQFATALIVACNEVDPSRVSDAKSLISAAVGSVRMGLMPGAEMGLCYFVPYKGRVQLIPGYRGYLDLALGNSYLRWVSTEVVYRGEEFRHWHDERGPHIVHEIPLDRANDDREIIGAYCSYQTRIADSAVPVVLNRSQIDKAKGSSQTDKVWRPHFAEMAMKTVIRRAAKRWKITPQLAKAIHYDELAERGEPQPLELPEGMEPEKPKRRLTALDDPEPEAAEPSGVYACLLGDIASVDDGDSDAIARLQADIASELGLGTITEDEAEEAMAKLNNKIPY